MQPGTSQLTDALHICGALHWSSGTALVELHTFTFSPTMTFTPTGQPAPDDLRIQNVKTYLLEPVKHASSHPLVGETVLLAGQDLAMPDIYMGTCLFFAATQDSAVESLASIDAVKKHLDVGLQRLASQYPAVSSHFVKVDGAWNIKYTGDGIPVTLAISDRHLGSSYLGRGGRVDSDVLPRGFDVSDHSDPAFSVKLTRFACGSIALGTSVHHWICDYAGYHDIMANLALALSDGAPLPPRNHSRDLGTLVRDVTSEDIPIHDWFIHQTGGKVWESAGYALSPDSVMNVMLYFSPENLVQLKFDTIRSARGEDWVSTNDTLAALLWSSLTAARGLTGHGSSKAVLTVDGRRFVPNSESYVGNVHTMHSSKASLDTLSSNTPSSLLQVAQSLRADLRGLSQGKMAAIIRLQDADRTTSFMPNYKPFFGHDVLISNLTKYEWSSLRFGKLGAPTYVSIITSAPVQAGPFVIEGSEGSIFIQNAPDGFTPAEHTDALLSMSGVDIKAGEKLSTAEATSALPTNDNGIRTQISNSLSKPGVIAIVGIRVRDVEAFTGLPHLLRYATVLP